jgi:hypothetical protein
MKLLALLVAFQTAFLFSIAATPSAPRVAAAAAAAADEPRLVHLEDEIVVVAR